MLTALYILVGSLLVLLALVVLANNFRSKPNRFFFYFALVGAFWLFSNLAVNLSSSPASALVFTRLTTASSALVGLLFLLFIDSYAGIFKRSYVALLWWTATLALVILSFTDFVVTDVSPYGEEVLVGIGYYVLLVFIVALFSYGGARLWGHYKGSKGLDRSRASYMLTGIATTFIVGITLNAVLPLLGYEEPAMYGALSVIFFSVFAATSIVKHKLFDIRLAVARLLTYILSVGTLVIAFIVASVGLTTGLLNFELKAEQQAYLVFLSILFALTFQPLKKFFDKISNSIFFRESYDPEVALNEYSDFLAEEITVLNIVKFTAKTLDKTLRPLKAAIYLYSDSGNSWEELTGTLSDDVKDKLTKTLEYQKFPLLFVSEQANTEEAFAKNLARTLKEEEIQISVRLSTKEELVGFLLLGDKRDGALFNKKDINFLSILANNLSIALQNAQRFEEIQKFNITLQEEIKKATKELRDTNEKLKELDEAKDEFISMASHQLRTPLTSVKGYLSMLLEGDVGNVEGKQQELIKSALTSAQRMVYLIADFLNVSRLRTGKFVIENKEIYLPDVIEEEMRQLKETAEGRGIELTYDKPKKFPKVMLDENKIRQVIMNFIDNAVYYSKPNAGGKVSVELKASDKSIIYQVVDNGIGVPKEDQKDLFGKFFRADNARKARPDGTGLGLFMAKKVVAAQGGAVIFKSTPGKGSTFGFTFPRDKIQAGK